MSDIKRFLGWSGVIGRIEYLGYIGIQFALIIASVAIVGSFPEDAVIPTHYVAIVAGLWLAAIWLSIVASLRRISDIGWSRWAFFFKAVPVLGLIFEVILLFKGPKEEVATV